MLFFCSAAVIVLSSSLFELDSLSTSSTNTVLETTLPAFKIIAPIIQSYKLPSTSTNAEHPSNPIFKEAWKKLLEGKYAELPRIAARPVMPTEVAVPA
jgi:hypothetical protein